MYINWLKILILTSVLFIPGHLRPQAGDFKNWNGYAAMQEDYRIDTGRHDQFYFRIKNANYLKNNEFANEFRIGSSITGLFLEPRIEYYAGTKTRISAGVHMLKYYGRDDFDRAAPVLSVQHALNENINMVFGTIYGTRNHGLKEPVFGSERFLTDNYENGIQFLLDYPGIKGDLWLNWEQFIKEGDPFQEKFTIGLNLYFDFFNSGNFHLGVPFQALFRHQGGQIDNTQLPSGTQSNFVQGFNMKLDIDGSVINRIGFEQNWCKFLEVNPGNHIKIPEGFGIYSILTFNTRIGEFFMGYWKSNDFNAPLGEGLFLSPSSYQPDFYMAEREILSIKYQYYYSINNFLDFVLKLEPYYHFHSGRIDHSVSVMLLFDKNFFLSRALNSPPPGR